VSSAGFLIIIVGFFFLWFIVMRPQKRRQVEQRRMLAALRPGDEVLTAGGIYGRVTSLADDEATVELAPGIEVRVARRAIAGVVDAAGDEAAADEEPDEEPDEGPDAEPAESTEVPPGDARG
jgi:preprotein translocase subunit YajC